MVVGDHVEPELERELLGESIRRIRIPLVSKGRLAQSQCGEFERGHDQSAIFQLRRHNVVLECRDGQPVVPLKCGGFPLAHY